MDNLRATPKFLLALAHGGTVVTPAYVRALGARTSATSAVLDPAAFSVPVADNMPKVAAERRPERARLFAGRTCA